MAHAGGQLGIPLVVFVPDTISPSKAGALKALGAEVRRVGSDCAVTEAHAREYSRTHGLTYISPYNDPAVVAGQGTVGSELLRQSPPLDAVYVAVGGGGLVAGVGAALKEAWADCEIIACSPSASAVMIESLAAGRILDIPSSPTLSEGTAGGLEAGSITFPLCQQVVDRCLQVSEDAIVHALFRKHSSSPSRRLKSPRST